MKTPLELLKEAPEEINPALEMAWELKRLELEGKHVDVHMLIGLADQIDSAQEVGRALVNLSDSALRQMKAASSQTSAVVPPGF